MDNLDMVTSNITYKYTDTGHWLARCNHSTGVIELNKREYPHLSPMMRDYIWIHEYVHLLYDVYDENECNRIADGIFISRAATPEEKRQRENFIVSSKGLSYSNIAATTIITLASMAISLGTKIYALYKSAEDKGYYSLSQAERKELLEGVIDVSFKNAMQGGKSAKQIFWGYVSTLPGVESNCDSFLNNSSNYQVRSYIAKCEVQYGFKFDTVLPVDWLAKPLVKYGLIALAVFVLLLVVIKKLKKH